ncbi:MAG: PilZ domain-containing protein [Bryobacteraceae bacterium]|jgi:hypothetical protein
MEERRAERRYGLQRTVLVYTYRDSRESTFGRIVDISANGLGLIVGAPLAEGEVVRVDVDKSVLLGTVLRCTPKDNHYAVGMKLLYSMTMAELKRILNHDFQSTDEASQLMKLMAKSFSASGGLKAVQRLLGL